MNESRLPFPLPWLRMNLLIHSITQRTWPEKQWRMIKPRLRRALAIRRDLSRAASDNTWGSGCRPRFRAHSAASHRIGWDMQMTQYGDGYWRATFYVTGQAHSIVGGSAYESTPCRGVQNAA